MYAPAAANADWRSNAVSSATSATEESVGAYKYDMAADVAALGGHAAAAAARAGGLARGAGAPSRRLGAHARRDGRRQRKSWIEKLGLVAAMLQSDADADADDVALAALGAYLRWLGTCETRCGEDSGSSRWRRHRCWLATVRRARSPRVRTPTARALARRVHPWLPSISAEFAGDNANDLRDAATRVATSRDVSASFRADFEARVRGPLSRNVGPAALVAAELLLQNAEATSNSTAREEMAGFVERLARYFNRAPALDRLGAMREGAFRDDRDTGAAVAELADAMEALDDFAGTAPPSAGETDAKLRALGALAGVRERFVRAIATPLSRDAPRDAVSRRQAYRMAKLALEEAARALLGRVETAAGVDGGGFASALASPRAAERERAWAVGGAATAHALGHLASSGWRAERAARAPTTSTLKRARVHYRVSLPTRIKLGFARMRCGSPRRSRAPRTSPPRTTPRSPPGTGTCPASSPTRWESARGAGGGSWTPCWTRASPRASRASPRPCSPPRAFVKDAESFSNEIARDARDEISTGSAVGIMAEVERLEPFAARGVAPPGTPLVVFAPRLWRRRTSPPPGAACAAS